VVRATIGKEDKMNLQCSRCGTFHKAKAKNFPKTKGYNDKEGNWIVVFRICKVCARNR